jgi:hypothetical protein
MNKKKEAALLAQERPQAQTIEPTNNVDQTPEDVNPHNALRELRLGREIPAADMVAVVSKLYPGYDKPLQSKCERSHYYGVQICNDAMNALYKVFSPEKATTPKKPDIRTNPCRLVVRVSVEDYNLLMDQQRAEGFSTTQDWLYSHLKKYLKAKGAYT